MSTSSTNYYIYNLSIQIRAKSYKYSVQTIIESVKNFLTWSQIIYVRFFRCQKALFSLQANQTNPSLLDFNLLRISPDFFIDQNKILTIPLIKIFTIFNNMFYIAVRQEVKSIDNTAIVQELAIKRDLYGILWIYCNQYIVGSLPLSS